MGSIAPQLIYLTLSLVGIGICIARYGQPKRDQYDLTDVLIAPLLAYALLWWGGFFDPLFGHG